jgi:hypothetical protein
MPKKELRGFKRITLKAGETKTVTFNLCADDFYYWNETTKQYDVLPGGYTFKVGGSSDHLPLSKTVSFQDSDKKPDLKITRLYTVPRYPQQGENVRFYALVKNQGNKPVGGTFDLDFRVDDQLAASANDVAEPIAPGQVKLIESDGTWTARGVEKYAVSGTVNVKNTVDEWDNTNNTAGNILEVLPPAPVNPALKKPVEYTGGIQDNDARYDASNLTDGMLSTRWASPHGQDNKVLIVDLQEIYTISKIVITWETAYASEFTVELSTDKSGWTQVYSGSGIVGMQNLPVNQVSARYVKINCIKRATRWGFSIYEAEVYGTMPSGILSGNKSDPGVYVSGKKLYFSNPAAKNVPVKIYDGYGKLRFAGQIRSGGFITNLQDWESGVYFVNYPGAKEEEVRKIII